MSKEIKSEVLEKMNEILGSETELIVLKGKMFMPMQHKRQEDSESYYTFRLKCIKKANEDAYSQAYNTYYCIMPVDVSKKFTQEEIKEMKDNEVICICAPRAYVRTFVNNKTGEQVAVNNINLYCIDLMKVREINKQFEKVKSLRI
jgi:hypothetical protein